MLIKIYEDDSRVNLIAVYSGFPWYWDCRNKILSINTTQTDAIQYKCEEINFYGQVCHAFQFVKLPEENDIVDKY